MALVHVHGIGLSSAFGGFQDSCAAARAGLSRLSDHAHMATMFSGEQEATPVSIARSADVYEGYQGAGRRVKLLLAAYKDLKYQLNHASLPENLEVLFATPDPRDRALDDSVDDESLPRAKRLSDYANTILDPFYKQALPELANKPVQMVFGERIAFIRILKKALECVSEGKHCLVLLVDSYLDEPMLQSLLEIGAAKTSDQPTGFVPGEGGACLLIGPAAKAKLGVTLNLALSFEPSTAQTKNDVDDEYESDGINISSEDWDGLRLFNQVKHVIPHTLQPNTFPMLITDMNGEEHRAIEYGTLQTFIQRDYQPTGIQELAPPVISFGDCGLLTGVYSFCQVVESIQRGYACAPNFLVLLSELEGRRGAIFLSYQRGS